MVHEIEVPSQHTRSSLMYVAEYVVHVRTVWFTVFCSVKRIRNKVHRAQAFQVEKRMKMPVDIFSGFWFFHSLLTQHILEEGTWGSLTFPLISLFFEGKAPSTFKLFPKQFFSLWLRFDKMGFTVLHRQWEVLGEGAETCPGAPSWVWSPYYG